MVCGGDIFAWVEAALRWLKRRWLFKALEEEFCILICVWGGDKGALEYGIVCWLVFAVSEDADKRFLEEGSVIRRSDLCVVDGFEGVFYLDFGVVFVAVDNGFGDAFGLQFAGDHLCYASFFSCFFVALEAIFVFGVKCV